MSKKFKKFRKNERTEDYDYDEWGIDNEDRLREKHKSKSRKLEVSESRKTKTLNFKDFRDS